MERCIDKRNQSSELNSAFNQLYQLMLVLLVLYNLIVTHFCASFCDSCFAESFFFLNFKSIYAPITYFFGEDIVYLVRLQISARIRYLQLFSSCGINYS